MIKKVKKCIYKIITVVNKSV